MMYKAIYKCRLCGEKIVYYQTENAERSENKVMLLTGQDNCGMLGGKTIRQNIIHYCEDGSFGFADFLGFKKFEE